MRNHWNKVDTSKLKPHISHEYVCLIDIMGTKNCMRESFQRSVNFILRLHSCVTNVVAKVNAKPENADTIRLHSIMDGVYLTCANLGVLLQAVKTIYVKLADVFINESDHKKQFLIRGSIARGDISHGEYITDEVCHELASHPDYIGHLLMGMPMIQAYGKESEAAPFGIYIHESARSYDGLQCRHFNWWGKKEGEVKEIISNLALELHKYFDWCSINTHSLKMEPQKITEYKSLVKEYFRISSPDAALPE